VPVVVRDSGDRQLSFTRLPQEDRIEYTNASIQSTGSIFSEVSSTASLATTIKSGLTSPRIAEHSALTFQSDKAGAKPDVAHAVDQHPPSNATSDQRQ